MDETAGVSCSVISLVSGRDSEGDSVNSVVLMSVVGTVSCFVISLDSGRDSDDDSLWHDAGSIHKASMQTIMVLADMASFINVFISQWIFYSVKFSLSKKK